VVDRQQRPQEDRDRHQHQNRLAGEFFLHERLIRATSASS
jgi:hypothetical protein